MDLQELDRLALVRRWAENGQARRIRLGAGLSVAEIASAVRVDRTTLNEWECGRRTPRARAALRYLDVLQHLQAVRVPV